VLNLSYRPTTQLNVYSPITQTRDTEIIQQMHYNRCMAGSQSVSLSTLDTHGYNNIITRIWNI